MLPLQLPEPWEKKNNQPWSSCTGRKVLSLARSSLLAPLLQLSIHPEFRMATAVPLLREIDSAHVLLMSFPPSPSESLATALHPLIICVLLLYCLPGLFSDDTAQAVWETYRLDTFIAGHLE